MIKNDNLSFCDLHHTRVNLIVRKQGVCSLMCQACFCRGIDHPRTLTLPVLNHSAIAYFCRWSEKVLQVLESACTNPIHGETGFKVTEKVRKLAHQAQQKYQINAALRVLQTQMRVHHGNLEFMRNTDNLLDLAHPLLLLDIFTLSIQNRFTVIENLRADLTASLNQCNDHDVLRVDQISVAGSVEQKLYNEKMELDRLYCADFITAAWKEVGVRKEVGREKQEEVRKEEGGQKEVGRSQSPRLKQYKSKIKSELVSSFSKQSILFSSDRRNEACNPKILKKSFIKARSTSSSGTFNESGMFVYDDPETNFNQIITRLEAEVLAMTNIKQEIDNQSRKLAEVTSYGPNDGEFHNGLNEEGLVQRVKQLENLAISLLETNRMLQEKLDQKDEIIELQKQQIYRLKGRQKLSDQSASF